MKAGKAWIAWLLFTAGGTLAAFLLPAVAFVLFFGAPLGLLGPADSNAWLDLARSGWTRAATLLLLALSLHHAAHRGRHFLLDGLQLHRFEAFLTRLAYGGAALLALLAGLILWAVG